MGLLSQLKELPEGKRVEIGGEDEVLKKEPKEVKEEIVKEEPAEKANEDTTEKANEDTKGDEHEPEPEKDAPKEAVEGYQRRKVKKYEEDAKKAREEADRAKRELEDWKKMAQTAVSRPVSEPVRAAVQEQKLDKNKDPIGYFDKKMQMLEENNRALQMSMAVNSASEELGQLESGFEKLQPDYREAMKYAEDRIVAREKILNPGMSEATIRMKFKKDKVDAAVHFLAQGKDPVRGLYELATEAYGYTKKEEPAKTAAADKREAEEKRFDSINKNKKKSGTPLAAGGSAGGNSTYGPEMAKGMTMKQFSKLSAAEKAAIFKDS